MRTFNATGAAGPWPWTAEYLAFVLPLKGADVLQVGDKSGATPGSVAEWAWVQTAQRLVDCHGTAGALARLNSYGRAA